MRLVLMLALSGCHAPRPPAGRERFAAEPRVRVGVLVDSPAVRLSATAPLEIVGAGGDIVASGAGDASVDVAADAVGLLSGTGSLRFGPMAGPLTVRVRSGGVLRIDGRGYRGSVLLVSDRPGRITAVNVLALEDYLRGVVSQEIGHLARAEAEAVKAQAVAARTYAIEGLGKRSGDFDFYATVQDQVYGGVAGEDAVANEAVADTRGEIVTYQGQPILAYYHSTCGGETAALDESWPWRTPQPYLRRVSDRRPGGAGSYCDFARRFRWTTTWTPAQLRSVLANAVKALTGGARRSVRAVESVRVLERTPGGRVGTLLVRADGRDYIVHGDSARYLLRTPAGALLNSSLLFDVKLEDGALVVHGGGWGHGIGMCQSGAIGRARAGQRYREILGTYYPGTRVTRLY